MTGCVPEAARWRILTSLNRSSKTSLWLYARRLKQAGITTPKSHSDFDWTYNPKLPKAKLATLASGRFAQAHGGVLLIGPPGVGKSHRAVALAVGAIKAGHRARAQHFRPRRGLHRSRRDRDATRTRCRSTSKFPHPRTGKFPQLSLTVLPLAALCAQC